MSIYTLQETLPVIAKFLNYMLEIQGYVPIDWMLNFHYVFVLMWIKEVLVVMIAKEQSVISSNGG